MRVGTVGVRVSCDEVRTGASRSQNAFGMGVSEDEGR